ncbi:MAG: nucleotidyltransferase family protein [Candidatus Magnetominusculus sp. LBB02]|nr:nucleotidyltransferase family protein [Candidatus Magnetominusculus sp. LBB02]
MQDIDVIILAGGLGTRLRPVIANLPKALAPVGGRPFLDILLGVLNRYNFIRRVVIAVGYLADKIIEQYEGKGGYNFELLFSREEKPLGTGGAVIRAISRQYAQTENVIAINGDTIAEVDFEDFASFHLAHGADMTIALKEMSDASRYGRVVLDSEGRVMSFQEKSQHSADGLINAGVYVFKRGLFGGYGEGAVISLERELLPPLCGQNLRGYVYSGRFIDIGVPKTYNVAGDYLSGYDNIENPT